MKLNTYIPEGLCQIRQPTSHIGKFALFPIDKLGLCALYFFISIVPFHQIAGAYCPYYKEVFTLIFFVLVLDLLFKRNITTSKLEMLFLVSFPGLLVLSALADTDNKLYDDSQITYSEGMLSVKPAFFMLRCAILHVPMVMYCAIRGVTRSEINKVARICVCVAPFSVSAYLYYTEDASLANILNGTFVLPYLNYVPYLTFAAMSGIFLVYSDSNLLFRFLALFVAVLIMVLAIISTGRQNVLFISISAFLFIAYSNRRPALSIVAIFFIISVLMICLGYVFIDSNLVSRQLLDRFSSLDGLFDGPKTAERMDGVPTRYTLMYDGLMMLHPEQFILGAGLTSSNGPGPHCDYVRWIQRVGLFVAAIGFLPFFMCFYRAYQGLKLRRTDPLLIYLLLTLGFTIYFSIFGFVREDAYESTFSYLGLAMALGSRRNRISFH